MTVVFSLPFLFTWFADFVDFSLGFQTNIKFWKYFQTTNLTSIFIFQRRGNQNDRRWLQKISPILLTCYTQFIAFREIAT